MINEEAFENLRLIKEANMFRNGAKAVSKITDFGNKAYITTSNWADRTKKQFVEGAKEGFKGSVEAIKNKSKNFPKRVGEYLTGGPKRFLENNSKVKANIGAIGDKLKANAFAKSYTHKSRRDLERAKIEAGIAQPIGKFGSALEGKEKIAVRRYSGRKYTQDNYSKKNNYSHRTSQNFRERTSLSNKGGFGTGFFDATKRVLNKAPDAGKRTIEAIPDAAKKFNKGVGSVTTAFKTPEVIKAMGKGSAALTVGGAFLEKMRNKKQIRRLEDATIKQVANQQNIKHINQDLTNPTPAKQNFTPLTSEIKKYGSVANVLPRRNIEARVDLAPYVRNDLAQRMRIGNSKNKELFESLSERGIDLNTPSGQSEAMRRMREDVLEEIATRQRDNVDSAYDFIENTYGQATPLSDSLKQHLATVSGESLRTASGHLDKHLNKNFQNMLNAHLANIKPKSNDDDIVKNVANANYNEFKESINPEMIKENEDDKFKKLTSLIEARNSTLTRKN